MVQNCLFSGQNNQLPTARIFFFLYLIAGLLNLYAHYAGNEALGNYTKPALMPLLLFYIYESSKGRVTFLILLLCIAVILSWGGDLALMYDGELFFVMGLGLFLLAHIAYSFLFLRSIDFKIEVGYWRILPVVLFAVFFIYYLQPHTGSMTIPVVVYALVISVMVGTALLRERRVPQRSFVLVAIGSGLFILSDAMIGTSKFVQPFYCAECLIMSTYIAAQLLITMGILEQNNAQSV